MDLQRVRSLEDFKELFNHIKKLFTVYIERTKLDITTEGMLNNYIHNIEYPDCFLFLFLIDAEIVGFLGCKIFRNSKHAFLLVDDVYCPEHGLEVLKIMRILTKGMGINELWGESAPNHFIESQCELQGATIKKQQIIKVIL